MERAANDGPDAICADEQVAFGRVAGCSTDHNPVAVRRESEDFAPERDRVQADGFKQRTPQSDRDGQSADARADDCIRNCARCMPS